jgi:hypothetical protein
MALAPVATVRVLGNSNADTHQTKAAYTCFSSETQCEVWSYIKSVIRGLSEFS